MPHNQPSRTLTAALTSLDGKPYGAYRDVARTEWRVSDLLVYMDRAQVDPYAPPSLMRVRAELPAGITTPEDVPGRQALADRIARCLARAFRGTDLGVGRIGQEILDRTIVAFDPHGEHRVELRLTAALPARGRRIKGRAAAALLTDELPRAVHRALGNLGDVPALLRDHRDREWLRRQLRELGLVAFVGDGAVLPRAAGNSDLPLKGAVPFESPEERAVTIDLPSGRAVRGMGIPEGVTVIVGGGFHGKSTLLNALQRGVYPHCEGDGREWVLTRHDAVAVRAEDGRAVRGTDISAFINHLPSGADTTRFSTTNASGSTSQAANLVEALEAGTTALLIDEDTSATNFMIRDEHMAQLVPAEPIRPLVDRAEALYQDLGVSTVLVSGGSAAFVGRANLVLLLENYRISDITKRAHEVTGTSSAYHTTFESRPERSLRYAPSRRKPSRAKGRDLLKIGKETLELGPAEQLVDGAQAQGLAHCLDAIEELLDGTRTLPEALDELEDRLSAGGPDAVAPFAGHPGLYALPRRHEVLAALSRWRG